MGPMEKQESNRTQIHRRNDIRTSLYTHNQEDPGYIGIDVGGPCLSGCKRDFVKKLGISLDKGEGWVEICHAMSYNYTSNVFGWLYNCDGNCGVAIDENGPLEQSPSVDLIINSCQNNGYYNITDPGPKSRCNVFCGRKDSGIDVACLIQPSVSIVSSTSSTIAATDASTLYSSVSVLPTVESYSTPLASTKPSSALHSSTTGAETTATETTAHDSSSNAITSSPNGLPQGAKIAVGVCSALAVLAIILALFFIRRKRKGCRDYGAGMSPTPNHSRTISETPSGSHTPLITPPRSSSSRATPMTPPPLRLSDRRFLPTIISSGSSPEATGPSNSNNDAAFPQSPICSPTTNKLVPRHERHATRSSIRSTLPQAPPPAVNVARGSLSSVGSGAAISSITAGCGSYKASKASSVDSSATIAGNATPPLSPTRPPRPHEGPLEIPDLVTPAGPPPIRALPSPPPNYPLPRSPMSPASPLSPTFSNRKALGPTSHPSTYSQQPQQAPRPEEIGVATSGSPSESSPIARLPTPSRDLCELTEAYMRERRKTRESWGSWSGGGGGGPGVAAVGKKRGGFGSPRNSGDRKGVGGASVALQELDLEKLGGSYRGRG